MATSAFDRYVNCWAPEGHTNGHLVPLPRTLLTGVPKHRRAEAEFEAEYGMPPDDVRDRLTSIQRAQDRVDEKLDHLIKANAAQIILNAQAERNREAIEGPAGILVRVKSLEDSRKWADFVTRSTIGALVGALITALVAWWRK